MKTSLGRIAFAALLAASLPGISTAFAASPQADSTSNAKPLNILLVVADDCEWDSAGVYGCPIPNITPNIDRLASEGVRFMNAYSTVAVCTPVRGTMMTGLLPHRSGAEGFEPIHQDVATINERLHQAGYLISLFGKNEAYEPHAKYCLDFEWKSAQGNRNAPKVYEYVKEAVSLAKKQRQPFFCHLNCGDPHRPFYGSQQEEHKGKSAQFGVPSRIIQPAEVPIPKFLDDIPGVRKEVAQYFCCVKRLDDCVGAALKALEESGEAGNTLVLYYGGDHGMSFPFAKSNAYLQSNHGGLIVRWPGVLKPNSVVAEPMVSTLDFTPTFLEAAKLPPIPNLDGRSFLSLLQGGTQDNRDLVFTYYYRTSGEEVYPMRAIRTRTDAYIWNAWSNGTAEYKAENMSGLSWKAMVKAGDKDRAMKARCDYYLHRVPEEYFVDAGDIGERNNLIHDPSSQARIKWLQDELQKHLIATGDPLASYFPKRHDAAAMKQLRHELAADNEENVQDKKGKRARKKAARATDPDEK